MKTSIYVLLFFVGLKASAQQQLQKSIYFSIAEHKLSPASIRTLEQIASMAKEYEFLQIQISGNTDNTGSSEYNRNLSKRRIQSAMNYLLRAGVPGSNIQTTAHGENKPLSSNRDPEGRSQNRRVDITITYQNKLPDKPDNIKDLFKQLATKPNEFCIDPTRDTVLKGKAGGIIEIKANSFDLKGRCKNKCVVVLLRENFTKSSMLLDNLTTMSNGEILESDGMVDLAAFDCEGNPLTLTKGKEMSFLIPTKRKLDDILFFDGAHDPNGNLNWTQIQNASQSLDDLGIDASCCKSQRDVSKPQREDEQCAPCKLLCRIGRLGLTIKAMSSTTQKKENAKFRACQKKLKADRKSKSFERELYLPAIDSVNCENYLKMLEKYGVTSCNALLDTLDKIRVREILKNIEDNFNQGDASMNELNYYVFRKSSLGLANCDRFGKYDKKMLTTMVFDIKRDESIDIKVAFEDEQIILPAINDNNSKVALDRVPKGKKVWVVALKMAGGLFFMDIFQTVIGEKVERINFKQVSLAEIQDALKRFDK